MRTRLISALLLAAACGRPVTEVPGPDEEKTVPVAPALRSATTGGCAPAPAACVSHAPFDPHLVSLTLSAAIVFEGTVQRLDGASYVASVDHALYGNGTLMLTEVTVDAPSASLPAVGTHAFFFVHPWKYGAGVEAEELGRVAPGTYPSISTDVPEIRRLAAERALYDELMAAGRVVVATVQSVAAQPVNGGNIGSEHDPLWTDSSASVQCTLRGAPSASAAVRFAASYDVAVYVSPKVTAGQQAVFSLHAAATDPEYAGRFSPNDGYTGEVIARPHDALPMSELQHVVDLLACPPTL
jgi:hypothetical protein